ncbi:MAG: PQQ-binding-like beta-propeller repeat protein, partial [Planctomycetota bacterium]
MQTYSPDERAWRDLAMLPAGRSSHDTVVHDDTLYVVGGWQLDTKSDTREWATDILTLDLTDPESGWSTIEAPFERRALATVALDDHLVAIGGISSERSISKRVDVLSLDEGAWTEGPEYPGAAFGVSAAVVDGRVVASGSDGHVYAWRPSDDEWTHEAILTFPRFFHQMVATPSQDVYVLGGTSRGMRPTHVERIAMAGGGPRSYMQHWTIPSPAAAKNRQGMFIEDGWLYAFGGNNSTGQHDFGPDNFLADGYRLSLASLTWREFDALPHPRQSIQTSASPDGKQYLALGGFAHDGEVARTFGEAFMYDLEERSWKETGVAMPTPRSQFGLV